jgi:hypothetical protein
VRIDKPVFCLPLALLAGCDAATPEDKAAQDARDVAWVEAAQKVRPPLQPLDPQPVSPVVRRVYKLTDAGCDFRPEGRAGADPVLVAGRWKAVLRLRNEPWVLAADGGSPEIAAGVRSKYAGRSHWAQLTQSPASLTIHDRWNRVVYASRGSLACRGRESSDQPGTGARRPS